MAISKGSSSGREACCFVLAVERYDAQDLECIVYEGDREQGYCCHSFIELARLMEQGIEKMEYPTPTVQKRRFSACRAVKNGEPKAKGQLAAGRREGRLGTFRVRVKQYFYATWQGQVSRDEEEKETAVFENFLEFVHILDGMLTGSRPRLQAEGGSLADSLNEALLFAGRYDGIWVRERDPSGVLFCGRDKKDGGKETFMVRPMFRENHTFQGSVSWVEGRQQKNFRSFLELLFLLMSAAGKQEQKEEDM